MLMLLTLVEMTLFYYNSKLEEDMQTNLLKLYVKTNDLRSAQITDGAESFRIELITSKFPLFDPTTSETKSKIYYLLVSTRITQALKAPYMKPILDVSLSTIQVREVQAKCLTKIQDYNQSSE